jgi:hypothetical protein
VTNGNTEEQGGGGLTAMINVTQEHTPRAIASYAVEAWFKQPEASAAPLTKR